MPFVTGRQWYFIPILPVCGLIIPILVLLLLLCLPHVTILFMPPFSMGIYKTLLTLWCDSASSPVCSCAQTQSSAGQAFQWTATLWCGVAFILSDMHYSYCVHTPVLFVWLPAAERPQVYASLVLTYIGSQTLVRHRLTWAGPSTIGVCILPGGGTDRNRPLFFVALPNSHYSFPLLFLCCSIILLGWVDCETCFLCYYYFIPSVEFVLMVWCITPLLGKGQDRHLKPWLLLLLILCSIGSIHYYYCCSQFFYS